MHVFISLKNQVNMNYIIFEPPLHSLLVYVAIKGYASARQYRMYKYSHKLETASVHHQTSQEQHEGKTN